MYLYKFTDRVGSMGFFRRVLATRAARNRNGWNTRSVHHSRQTDEKYQDEKKREIKYKRSVKKIYVMTV